MEIKKFNELSEKELDVMSKMHYDFFSKHNSTLTLESVKNIFKNIYTNTNELPYGIALFENNTLIGFCNMRMNALKNYECEYPYICGVYILKEFRNMGYGKKIINFAKEELRKLNYKKAYLWTQEIPTYYEKLGFSYVENILKNDGTGYAKLYMIKLD